MTSSDYRLKARQSLAGKWTIAVVAALIAGLLGGLITGSGSFNLNIDEEVLVRMPAAARSFLGYVVSFASTLALAQFLIGGVIRLGYSRFLLKMHDGRTPELSDLFSQFHRFGDGFCLHLLRGIYVFLWSLLFIIPGIIASLSYAMAPFLMVENPNMTASQAIAASKEMMDGHKTDLFILELSFIGWGLLNVLTLGIGSLWLNPYMNAAFAAFYRSIGPKVTVEAAPFDF